MRTAPSAGALYPLELHVIVQRVEGLPAGVYRYAPSQPAIAQASLLLAIAAAPLRTSMKYVPRASRYVAFEAGAASQNIALQAASLGLGTVVIGAFDDDAVARALQLPPGQQPLALMPVGKRS